MRNLFSILLVSLVWLGLTSCGGNEEDPAGSSSMEWYATPFASASDFAEINAAIANHELLYSSKYGGDRYAEPDLFFAEYGFFSTAKPYFGRLRFTPTYDTAQIMCIEDENTIVRYLANIYRIEDATGIIFKKFNAGNLGTLCFSTEYSGSYFTYVEIDGKLILSNGEIFTRRGNLLIPEGSSTPYEKFTPYQY